MNDVMRAGWLRVAFAGVAFVAASTTRAFAGEGEIQFEASIDRSEATSEDSISLRLSVIGRDQSFTVQELRYQAPEFELLNQYPETFQERTYDDQGYHVTSRSTRVDVLRPKRAGNFRIQGIQAVVEVGGKATTFAAPDLSVRVGAASRSSVETEDDASGVGSKVTRGGDKKFFVQANASASSVFQGEGLTVSYWLYRKVQLTGLQIDKFPTLNGFLREELEMPAQSGTLNWERVTVSGEPFLRALLVKYRAYPLKAGRLKIDPLAIKTQYFAPNAQRNRGGGQWGFGSEDFFGQLFGALTPIQGTSASAPLEVEVQALPSEGRPADYTGAVGQFEILATVNRTELKAGEALTVMVKVDGAGNLASVELPEPKWPKGFQAYESKSRVEGGSKIFEYLLISRAGGDYEFPPFELKTFNPKTRTYQRVKSGALNVRVIGDATPAVPQTGGSESPNPAEQAPTRWTDADWDGVVPGMFMSDGLRSVHFLAPWFGALWLALALLTRSLKPWWRRRKGAHAVDASVRWKRDGESLARDAAQVSPTEAGPRDAFLGRLEEWVLSGLERELGHPVRSLSRDHWSQWDRPRVDLARAAKLLDAVEAGRFGSATVDPKSLVRDAQGLFQ